MKPFHFTLGSVHTLRLRQEQKAEEKYAQSLVAQRQAQAALEKVAGEMEECWNSLRAGVAAGCTAAQAAQMQAYEKCLSERREECLRTVEAANRRVNAELQTMLQARQQREIVDKCLEKQKARHEREAARAEQKRLDELSGRGRNSILAWKQPDPIL